MTVENQILVIRLKKDSSKTNVNYNSKNGLHNLIRIIIRRCIYHAQFFKSNWI